LIIGLKCLDLIEYDLLLSLEVVQLFDLELLELLDIAHQDLFILETMLDVILSYFFLHLNLCYILHIIRLLHHLELLQNLLVLLILATLGLNLRVNF
jgi:hypothetical protein